MFQSHAGSIEARVRATDPDPIVSCFNPTLVRLRPARRPTTTPPWRCFNPTLVRLRRGLVGSNGWRALIVFQSHAGSIEAHPHCFPTNTPHLSFNPTLVRLRPSSVTTRRRASRGFNPTLVRLRRSLGSVWAIFVRLFQSHAGSIEAIQNPNDHTNNVAVSIPRWFD